MSSQQEYIQKLRSGQKKVEEKKQTDSVKTDDSPASKESPSPMFGRAVRSGVSKSTTKKSGSKKKP